MNFVKTCQVPSGWIEKVGSKESMFLRKVVSRDFFSTNNYSFIDSGRRVLIKFRSGIYKVREKDSYSTALDNVVTGPKHPRVKSPLVKGMST